MSLGAIDVREIARDVAEEYRAQAESKGLAIDCHLPPELPMIESDGTRIRQIVGNLVSNAVKYTREGRVDVTVAVRAENDSAGAKRLVVIDVSDTGPGIPEDKKHLIFLEFTRLETAGEQGAGIGLAISQKVAAALGGRITVASEPRRGSAFTLWLPIGALGEVRAGVAR